MYLPQNADADGWGTRVEREVEEWIRAAARPTRGCASTRRRSSGASTSRPSEVDPAHPLVAPLQAACAAVGEPAPLGGLDSWFDAATFTRFGGTPCSATGRATSAGRTPIDEHVPVDDLVRCARRSRSRRCAGAAWPSDAGHRPGWRRQRTRRW